MKQEEYVKSVIRKLQCSGQKKQDIERELNADIQTAIADGESWEEVETRMGTPEQLAAEFNENLSPQETVKRKRKKGFVIGGIIVGIFVLCILVGYWILPKNYELEKSGVFQKTEVTWQAETIISMLNHDDYEALKEYANSDMQSFLAGDAMEEAKATLGDDLGAYQGYSESYMVEMRQMGKRFAVVQILAEYENRNVVYTITFDEDMKLAGLYMR